MVHVNQTLKAGIVCDLERIWNTTERPSAWAEPYFQI